MRFDILYIFTVIEKRAGILKPQGSLERARGEKMLSRAARIDVVSPDCVAGIADLLPDSAASQVSNAVHDVISTTVQTQNDEKKFSKNYESRQSVIFRDCFLIVLCSYCYTPNSVFTR